MELLKCEPFPRPPPQEQAAIVRYLDHADRRIRRYIRAKQKLITLLEEQKQAIIHQAVTGVDIRTGQPYPAYKPSGVEWLGDMPEHWEVSSQDVTCQKTLSSSRHPDVGPLRLLTHEPQHHHSAAKVSTVVHCNYDSRRGATSYRTSEVARCASQAGDLLELHRLRAYIQAIWESLPKGSIRKCTYSQTAWPEALLTQTPGPSSQWLDGLCSSSPGCGHAPSANAPLCGTDRRVSRRGDDSGGLQIRPTIALRQCHRGAAHPRASKARGDDRTPRLAIGNCL